MKGSRIAASRLIVASLVLAMLTATLIADNAEAPKPSQYAPAKELRAQLEMFIEGIEKDLSDKDDYDEEHVKRVSLNASTLIVLGQLLGIHDEQHDLQKAAPAPIEAASTLTDVVDDYDAAAEAFGEVRAALASTAGGEIEFEPIADLGLLMMQVPIVNNNLRRGVTSRRFSRYTERNAGYAATLAAIAQASLIDTVYCVDSEDEAKWAKICGDMRDAATAIQVAVRNQDQDAAKAALADMVETCDACHHAFRD